MRRLVTAHTADLDQRVLAAAHDLVVRAFGDDFTDQDWEHGLGGLHVLAYEDDELVGHGSVVQRRLIHGGRALRAGYLEGAGVRADRRRRGHAAAIFDELERIVRGAYDLGALSATDDAVPFYESRGWPLWRGRISGLTPEGVVPMPDEEGGIYVYPVADGIDLDGELTADWRDGDLW